ncbi:MAG: DUF2764 domain-containing protein [candidate division KSB1 bacterium]|nr:DUF2764 domain-containing protein [candidate division KSB1 bacterium]
MDKYYYLVAQLPMLWFDREAPLSTEVFLQEAEKWMSAADFEKLRRARFDALEVTSNMPSLLRQYAEHEAAFRRDLAQWRKAQKEGFDYKPEIFPVALVKEGNPLEVEKNLLHYRWNLIEELETLHHFDLEFLIFYYFKLQILEKMAEFNKEKGRQVFQSLTKVDI